MTSKHIIIVDWNSWISNLQLNSLWQKIFCTSVYNQTFLKYGNSKGRAHIWGRYMYFWKQAGVPTTGFSMHNFYIICVEALSGFRNSTPHSVQRVCSKTDMLLFEWRTYFIAAHTFLQYVRSLLDVAAYSMTTWPLTCESPNMAVEKAP